nr:uncharacterized protein LOC109168900 [Ipomoea batatas]
MSEPDENARVRAPLKELRPIARVGTVGVTSVNLLNKYLGGEMSGDGNPTPDEYSLWRCNEEVFSFNGRRALIKDFLSLQFDCEIRMGVIECWTYVLNEQEKFKIRDAPSRLFATPYTALHTIISPTADLAVRLEWFTKRLDKVLQLAPHINCATVDLFFFPILKSNYYYVLCVNTKRRRFEIIDISSVASSNKDRYGDIPDDLIYLLSTYLQKKGQAVRAATVENMRPIRMQMWWRHTKQKEDCGVYAMRHMSHTWVNHAKNGIVAWKRETETRCVNFVGDTCTRYC